MRYLFTGSILLAGAFLLSVPGDAKVEFTKKEKKSCTYCHTTAKGPELNDAGKYYKDKKTLEGFVPKS